MDMHKKKKKRLYTYDYIGEGDTIMQEFYIWVGMVSL